MNITYVENTHPGTLPPSDKLGFGSVFTDHMFIMDYSADQGWHDARIVPYAPIPMRRRRSSRTPGKSGQILNWPARIFA